MREEEVTKIRLSEGDVIAALPHMLGFHPEDSVVLMAVNGKRLGMTMRADIPDESDAPFWVEQLMVPIRQQQATGVVVVVVGGKTVDGDLPHRVLVDALDTELLRAGVRLMHAAWTERVAAGAPWRCYDDPLCGGVVPNPASTAMAAASVACGVVAFGSRNELAAVLDTDDDPEALVRRAVLLLGCAGQPPMSAEVVAERLAQLDRLRQVVDAAGGIALVRWPVDDELVVQVASALRDHRVRDVCCTWCIGDGAAAAEGLWLALVRATPAPERAEPATLLALAAYSRGDGALAGVALEAAQAAHPGHTLSRMLRTALDGGLPPDMLRAVLAETAEQQNGAPQ